MQKLFEYDFREIDKKTNNLLTYNNLETCDILLFSTRSYVPVLVSDYITSYITGNKYTDISIIVRNPKYIDNCLSNGTYILEFDCNKFKLTRLEEKLNNFDGVVYLRKLKTSRNDQFYQNIKDIYEHVCSNENKITSNFNMIMYVYTTLGFFENSVLNDKDELFKKTYTDIENAIMVMSMKFVNCELMSQSILKKYDMYVHYIYRTF